MNEFEISYFTILLDRIGWKWQNVEHWTYFCILGIYTKLLCGKEYDSSLLMNIISRNSPEFTDYYTNFICDEETMDKINENVINIRLINERFKLLNKPINTYCRNNYINYNGIVDKIVKLSQPYGDESNGNQLKSNEQFNSNNGIIDKNEIKININKNEVIVRADSFLALYYYFKGSLPMDEIMDNLYQVEKINKAQQIQINFNDSKFQLQTSFDGNENLHLDISSFVILYNSFEDGVFPYGNIFITLNTISTTFISKNHSRKLFYTKNDFLYFQIENSKLNINLEVRVGILIINLSYSDILSFLRAYLLNKLFFNNERSLSTINF